MLIRLLTSALALFIASSTWAADSQVSLNYTGFGAISDNRTETITPADGYSLRYFYGPESTGRGNLALLIENHPVGLEPYRVFTFLIGASVGHELQAGYYGNANYWTHPTPELPFFSFSANNSASNFVEASFEILAISFDSHDILTSLALNFSQTEDAGLGMTHGGLRYNSDIPLAPVPEPGTHALMFAGLGLVGWAARRKKAA